MIRPIFKNPGLDKAFKEDGYVVLNMLEPDAIHKLLSYGKGLKNAKTADFYTTISDDKVRVEADNLIRQFAEPAINKRLANFDLLFATFMTKRRSIGGKIGMHVDWQFVEEPQFLSINTWIALHDINFWSGGLQVIPQTHKAIIQLRGPNYIFFNSFKTTLKPKKITLKAGQAIMYDSRLLHASGYNFLMNMRVVASALLIPAEAEPVYVFFNPDDSTKPYYMKKVSKDFYLHKCSFGKVNNIWPFSNPDKVS